MPTDPGRAQTPRPGRAPEPEPRTGARHGIEAGILRTAVRTTGGTGRGPETEREKAAPIETASICLVGIEDLNLRPPAPEAGHDTKLLGSVFTRLEHPPGGCP